VAICLAVAALVAGCSGGDHQSAAHELAADYSGSGPGTLIAAYPLPAVDARLRSAAALAARITYTSTSGIDDSHPEVSAAVFVPRDAPPPTGWPIIAFGHPSTGINKDCAPSRSPTLMGSSGAVTALLSGGYVVVVSDYQGLGLHDTYHPYLDSTTVGLNLIDSVFATRRLVPTASLEWVAVGMSQGGQAAWAADELADNAGQGLHLLGAVSVSPLADILGLADVAVTGELTPPQRLALQGYLASLKKEYPDFNLDDYRRGMIRDRWDVLSACQGAAALRRAKLADQISADDLRPAGPTAADLLRGFLQKTNLPQGPTAAPMLVVYGGRDALIPAAWTERALGRACQMGDEIQIEREPQNGSVDIDTSGARAWIKDRFAGAPARDDCASLAARTQLPVPAAASNSQQIERSTDVSPPSRAR
jgi:pimeloyl-ACP methyl ester carboxylesterase